MSTPETTATRSVPAWLRRLFPHGQRLRDISITVRTALLAWLVAIGTLMIFVASVIPEQKRTFVENLRSKAYGVTVSLRDIIAGAAVNEDFSSVVDQCTEMLRGDPAIDYIVVTRNDGFSIVHDRSGWRTETLDATWHPAQRAPFGDIRQVPLFGRRAYAYARPFDYSGIEWGWIHVGLSIAAYDRSVANVYQRTGLLVLLAILLGFIASIVYARRLVRPILLLKGVVERVAAGNLAVRAKIERGDELGQLAGSINSMTEALLQRDRTLKEANETLEERVNDRTRELQEQVAAKERAHQALAEAQQHLMQLSREAGRAEVATGVLHSVGNVLNSVNVSATLVQNQLDNSNLHGLQRAIRLLVEHRGELPAYLRDNPQGRHLPDYLIEVSHALATEHATWRSELDGLAQHVSHIKEIVAMQQSYARVAGVSERLAPSGLVADALRVAHTAFLRHGITVTTDFEPTPEVVVDKHKVLQILINLLTNAKWAVSAHRAADRRVRIAIRCVGQRVQIAIVDNGIGIPAENLSRIFRHGFTTRRGGHGFGLHMGALAAQELGGALLVHSDGPGRGATFTLELPVECAAGAAP